MEYTVNAPDYHEVFVGTSLRGYLDASYQELVDTFGDPLPSEEFDGKADAVWMLQFADGTVASVYNYKDGKSYLGEAGTPTEELRNWHIGGKTQRAVALVHWLLGKQLETGAEQQ